MSQAPAAQFAFGRAPVKPREQTNRPPGDSIVTNADEVEEREAEHGKKMIEVKVRFWTDGLATAEGHVLPKHAWAAGVVRLASNTTHGIVTENPLPFNSLLDLNAVIEKALIAHDIQLHTSRKMKKYWANA